MKTIRSAFVKKAGVMILVILCSCQAYRPCLTSNQLSPEAIREKITSGKKYKLTLTGGKTAVIKVTSVEDDRLVGDVSTAHYHLKNFQVPLTSITAVEHQKFSAVKTLAVIIIPVAIFALIAGSWTMEMGNISL